MEINRSDIPQRDAGEALSKLLAKYQDKPILLLLSGGSSLGLLPFVEPYLISEKVTLGVVDERFSFDSDASNYLKLQGTDFYKSAIASGCKVIVPPIREGVFGSDVAVEWESSLKNWFGANPDGVCLVTIGIGPDGHIAGMFPGDWEVDFDGEAWTVFYTVPKSVNPYTERLTITSTFLQNKVTDTIVYATGEDKKFVIKALIENNQDLDSMPAKVLHKLKSASFYTSE